MQTNSFQDTCKKPAPWYRHRWPWLIMLGPFLVVLAGSYTMWLAYSRQDALVVGDYYSQGKSINRDLTRDRAAVGLGLRYALRYDAASGRLLGRVSGASSAVQGPMTLKLVHSTPPEKNIVLPLLADADETEVIKSLGEERHGHGMVLQPRQSKTRSRFIAGTA